MAADRRMGGRKALAEGSKLYLRRAPQTSQSPGGSLGPGFWRTLIWMGEWVDGWEHGSASEKALGVERKD